MNRSTIGMLAVILLAAPTYAQFTFDPAVTYIVGDRPADVAAGDFNGNGHIDLAVTVDNPDRVVILLNNGSGTFTPGQTIFTGGGTSPEGIVAGDLNGNGHIDLAVGLKGPNQVRIYINQGGANFAVGGSFATGLEPRGMDIGDFDGDGRLDLIVANRDSDNVTVLRNTGNAAFALTSYPVGEGPRAATFGDFTGNGLLDFAVSNHRDRNVGVYLNNGQGGFNFAATLSVGTQIRPEGIVCVDLNGNGLADIATGTGLFATVFYATGGGAFTGANHFMTGGQNSSKIAAGDFDCNGRLDLATANADSNNVSVLPNLGSSFGTATIFAAGTYPDALVAADLTGNGAPDLAVANRDSNSVTVHLNRSCTAVFGLSTSGQCPGAMLATATGATPQGWVAFIAAFGRGSVVIPQPNPCAGTQLGLNQTAWLLAQVRANSNGNASVSGNAPLNACGRVFLQALDVSTCRTSNVVGI